VLLVRDLLWIIEMHAIRNAGELFLISMAIGLTPPACEGSIIADEVILNVPVSASATDPGGNSSDSDAIAWFAYTPFNAARSASTERGEVSASASGTMDWQPGPTGFSASGTGTGSAVVTVPDKEEALGTGGSFLKVTFGVDAPSTFDLLGLTRGLIEGDPASGLYVQLLGSAGQTIYRTASQNGIEPFYLTGSIMPGERYTLEANTVAVAVAGLSSASHLTQTRVDNYFELRLEVAPIPDCPSTWGITTLGLIALFAARRRWCSLA
jgi:hypothetical protein